MKLKKKLYRNYINYNGIKANKKIVVLESDDWGSLRMPSPEIYSRLKKTSIDVESCPYSRYDSLEMEEDLDYLYEVLDTIKDSVGNSPTLTANFLMANPDFNKIKEDGFRNYYFQDIRATYKNTEKSEKVLEKICYGIAKGFIKPQLHGREHLNIKMWLHLLRTNDDVKTAFNHGLFAMSFTNSKTIDLPYLAAFMKYNASDDFGDIICSSINIYNKVFKSLPESFIAPVYVWDKQIEMYLNEENIKSIQGLHTQRIYKSYDDRPKKKIRTSKIKNEFGQLNLVRNCFFEPSTKNNYDWVNECLEDIASAFFWNRPAIICLHRINFMGRIDENNRTKNLKIFKELLNKIVLTWPDVRFVSSDKVYQYLEI